MLLKSLKRRGILNNCVLFAPHCDDETLFASNILQKYRPTVIIVSDDTREKFKISRPDRWLVRRAETCKALSLLNLPVIFLGLDDGKVTLEELERTTKFLDKDVLAFAPTNLSENNDHNIVSQFVYKNFKLCLFYPTYGPNETRDVGEKLEYTEDTSETKRQMAECYFSQWPVIGNLMNWALEEKEMLVGAEDLYDGN
jgi:LmbE family N-acetylglucosaminyl deacetylase